MAKQRQTDININYKVNTVDIERGNAILNRASQATDQLRSVTNNFGNSAGRTFQSTSKHIEGMEIELQRLRQQIKLTSTEDTARLQKLSAQYKALDAQVKQYNRTLFEQNRATQQTAASTQQLASNFNSVVTGVKLFISANIAKELVNMSLAAATLSGNVEGVQRAFERQIPNSIGLLNDLRRATQGAVTDLELMQKALQAQNFGIDVQRLPELLEFAAVRAQQTGISVDYLVNSIVTGIGRKSILILDNLGISATRLKEEFNGAALASQSVADVTNAVADIAREEMQKMGGYVTTAATHVDQLTVSWTSLREEIAKAFTTGPGGGIIETLKSYVDSFKALVEAWNRGIPVSEVFAEQQNKMIAQMTVNEFTTRVLTGSKEENIKAIEDEVAALTKSLGEYAKARDATQETIKFLRNEIVERRGNLYVIEDNIKLIQKGLDIKKKDALIDQETLKLLQGKLQALRAVNKEQKEASEEDRSLVTDPVALFSFGKSTKVPIDQQMLKQSLVDVKGQVEQAAKELFIVLPVTVKPVPVQDSELEDLWEDFREEMFNSALNNTGMIIEAELQRDVEYFNQKIQMARDYYDREILLAGDNQEAKKELRLKEQRELEQLQRKRADAEKKAALASILVSTGIGIMKIWAGDGSFYEKIFRSAIVAGEGAAQYIIAQRARYYAKGEIDIKGPGTKTSDSIPAMLSRGESVMTADETASSKGIFKAVRAKKLNDKVLKEIVSGRAGGASVTNLDVTPIVHGLKELKNSQPDIVKRANMIYEVRKKGENYKQIVRSKSMSV